MGVVAIRTWKSILTDRLFGRAAELGFYFLFALFPTLFCASSILGLAARSANQFYDKLLNYLALVIPTSALGTVLVLIGAPICLFYRAPKPAAVRPLQP